MSIIIRPKDFEPFNNTLKRFQKAVKKSKILELAMSKLYHTTKNEKRHLQKLKIKKRNKKRI